MATVITVRKDTKAIIKYIRYIGRGGRKSYMKKCA